MTSIGRARGGAALLAVIVWAVVELGAQSYTRGQNVSPGFEGWEQNPDGSFSFLFGYMNRNWEEELDIPVGPDNSLAPGSPDQGQPTHFLPRRNRFVFKVRVPKDFGNKELVWTITAHGKTEKAFATLRPDYLVDDLVQASEQGALGIGISSPAERRNQAPELRLDGQDVRTVQVGQALDLTTWAADDGVPKPRFGPNSRSAKYFERPVNGVHPSQLPPRAITVQSQTGLRVSWYVYRGPNAVVFEPEQAKVWEDTRAGANSPWAPRWLPPAIAPDGKIVTAATFSAPGTYVLRCLASDGALGTSADITVTVTP